MNKNPKFIDVVFTGGRKACFVMQENGKFYSYFLLPYPSYVISVSVETVENLVHCDLEIISVKVHN